MTAPSPVLNPGSLFATLERVTLRHKNQRDSIHDRLRQGLECNNNRLAYRDSSSGTERQQPCKQSCGFRPCVIPSWPVGGRGLWAGLLGAPDSPFQVQHLVDIRAMPRRPHLTLDLSEFQFDARYPAEYLQRHRKPGTVLIDLLDDANEGRERTGHHTDQVTLLEHREIGHGHLHRQPGSSWLPNHQTGLIFLYHGIAPPACPPVAAAQVAH
jgi:hypothetical protein